MRAPGDGSCCSVQRERLCEGCPYGYLGTARRSLPNVPFRIFGSFGTSIIVTEITEDRICGRTPEGERFNVKRHSRFVSIGGRNSIARGARRYYFSRIAP